jgi:hypothetical protein
MLQMGGNTVLSSPKGYVTVSYDMSHLIDISLTAFLLTDSDKVQGDSGIIFIISQRVLLVQQPYCRLKIKELEKYILFNLI